MDTVRANTFPGLFGVAFLLVLSLTSCFLPSPFTKNAVVMTGATADLKIVEVTADSIRLRWSAPDGQKGTPDHYRILLKEDNGTPAGVGWTETEFRVKPGPVGGDTTYTHGSLTAGKQYLLKLQSKYVKYTIWSGDSNLVKFRASNAH